MLTYRKQQSKRAAGASFSERRAYEAPVMDRELPLALFAAVVSAVALVAIQVHASSTAQKKEAASHLIYSSVQHRPDSRLASSQLNFTDNLEQRVR